MTKELGVGIIGCGNISTTYFKLAPLFRGIKVVACADINPAAAEARAAEYGVKAESIEALLANPDVDIVVNLTIPDAHYPVSKAILEAGKHVYSEKPLVLSLEQGEELRAIAKAKGLSVGCAPDTFLGGAHQLARSYVDAGKIGRVTSGTCHVMSPGMEMWHPNPDFFFLPGGGPILDLGPYYIANLINLIGPVKRVAALATMANPTRTITSEPRKGEVIPVKTPTNIHALLEFENGATITLSASGMSGRTAMPTWSFTAPKARSTCPTRTSSAARWKQAAATRKSSRWSPGIILSVLPTRSIRRGRWRITAPPALPTWRSPSSRAAMPAARSTVRCTASTSWCRS